MVISNSKYRGEILKSAAFSQAVAGYLDATMRSPFNQRAEKIESLSKH